MHFTLKDMYDSKYYRARVQKAKENNTCPQCNKPMDRKGFYCRECTDKKTIEIKKTRELRKELGLCPRCGKVELWGDEKVCLECSARDYENTMRTREKEHYNQVHREWSKRTHQEMIEKGICTRCRKRKADYGFKTCGVCRDKTRKRYIPQNTRQERVSKGLCFFCDNPTKKGYKVCEKHYQINVDKANCENAKRARKKMKKKFYLY